MPLVPPRSCACVAYTPFLTIYNVFSQRYSSISADRGKILIQCGPFSSSFYLCASRAARDHWDFFVLCFAAIMFLCCRGIWRALESLLCSSWRDIVCTSQYMYAEAGGHLVVERCLGPRLSRRSWVSSSHVPQIPSHRKVKISNCQLTYLVHLKTSYQQDISRHLKLHVM